MKKNAKPAIDEVSLNEFIATRSGSVDPTNFPDESFELYSIPAFDRGTPDIAFGSEIGSTKQVVQSGDVLLSKIVPHIRRSWVVGSTQERRLIASGEWIVFRSKRFHGPYLRHLLTSDLFNRQFMNTVSGIGGSLLRARPSHVAKIRIPLPSLDEQKRIAYVLSKVEGLIAQRKQHLQQLDDLLKSVFLDMFGDPVGNEKGWETKPLNKIASVKRGKFTPRPRNDPKYFDGPFPFIQTGDIARSRGRLREYTQTLNELGTSVSRNFEIGTIVIAIVGATIGETAILEISTYATDSVIGITLRNPDFETEPVFLEFVLRHWKAPLRAKAPEAARVEINIETLTPLPIICPPSHLKLQFCELAERLERLKGCYTQSIIGLESLYAVSSQQAFKGMLDLSRVLVPDPIAEAQGDVETAEQAEDITDDSEFELPTPADLKKLGNTNGRKEVVSQWLDAYALQLGKQPFSNEAFISLAQQKLSELQSADDAPDYDFEVSATDYDHVKDCIFQNLESKHVKQEYDDAHNRVQISVAED